MTAHFTDDLDDPSLLSQIAVLTTCKLFFATSTVVPQASARHQSMTVFDIEFQQGDWLVLIATVDKLHQVKVIL